MFDAKPKKQLHQQQRFGQIDVPAASEETLEKYNDLYNKVTESVEEADVLILGATPELRDIALSHGHNVTTVERDSHALERKTKQMYYQGHDKENQIIKDWLQLDMPTDSFDAIIGDGVLTGLLHEHHKKILSILRRIVRPTGNILLRESSVIPGRPHYDPTMHIHEYRTGQYNLFDLFFGLRLYNKNFNAIDGKTRRSYLKEFHTKISEYFKNGLLSKREKGELDSVAEEMEHTLLQKNDLEDLLRAYFFPKEIVHDIGSGHLSPWYFFLLQPNEDIEMPEHVPSERYNYVAEFLANQTESGLAE